MALSASVPNAEWANMFGPLILVVMMLFGGFYANTANIPDYFLPLEYISFMKYSFAGNILDIYPRYILCSSFLLSYPSFCNLTPP